MNRRQASKAETRKLILKAARKLLVQKGKEDCTLKEIAEEAGASAASVVVHFKNKIALMEEALYVDIEKTLIDLSDSLPINAPLLERLMHIPKGFLRFYDSNRNLYRIFIKNTILQPMEETPFIARQSEQYIKYLSIMIEGEKKSGFVKPEVDVSIAAASLFSLYLGALATFFRIPEMPVEMITHGLTAMTQQFLVGITCEVL